MPIAVRAMWPSLATRTGSPNSPKPVITPRSTAHRRRENRFGLAPVPISLPSNQSDDQHYITVRPDTPDANLPPEGSRISPAWAGVASLPGRPPFAQPSGGPAKLLATIVVRRPDGVGVGDHIRFIGIEWTTLAGTNVGRMVTAEHANHVIRSEE